MLEMLGNQYFMARNYALACETLEKALKEDPENKPIRRKLIICNTQIGNMERSLDLFISLVKEDADFIINTDPIDDDCPCADLLYNFERKLHNNLSSTDYHIMLGILWLYCNTERSIHFFEAAREMDPENSKLRSVLSLLSTKKEN